MSVPCIFIKNLKVFSRFLLSASVYPENEIVSSIVFELGNAENVVKIPHYFIYEI